MCVSWEMLQGKPVGACSEHRARTELLKYKNMWNIHLCSSDAWHNINYIIIDISLYKNVSQHTWIMLIFVQYFDLYVTTE
jgi:hypothetical protein